jgi:hypothetical protein
LLSSTSSNAVGVDLLLEAAEIEALAVEHRGVPLRT